MLVEIASMYNFLVNQEQVLSKDKLASIENFSQAYNSLNYVINNLLKYDPIQSYRALSGIDQNKKVCFPVGKIMRGILWFLEKIFSYYENLTLIKKMKELSEQGISDSKEIYSQIFRPDIMPNFTFTRMVAKIPADSEIIDQYEIATGFDRSTVTILKEPNKAKYLYHLTPPEYSLKEEHHFLLNLAKNVLIEHRPTTEEFNDLQRTRQVFFNVSRDLLRDLASSKNMQVSYSDLDRLATILVRHTIGFGVIEVLLQDEHLQDLSLNAPVALSPIFVKHSDYDECSSNIIVSHEDVESWAAKFRMLSWACALDEANPILDTSLNLNNFSARVAIIQQPL